LMVETIRGNFFFAQNPTYVLQYVLS